jgi:hypothetical protein
VQICRYIRNSSTRIFAVSITQTSHHKYSHAPHNDVSVNDGPHIRRWSHNIIILYYNTYHA